MSSSDLAVIDLEPWWDGDEVARREVGAAFDAAARSVGFAHVIGHRIPDAIIDGMVSESDAFFDLPSTAKLAARPADLTVNRGYAASGTEALSYSIGEDSPPDLFEAFNLGEDAVDDSDSFYVAERHRLFAPNIWPSAPPGLRPALVAYFAETRRVALALTDVFAVALDLPERWFRPFVERSTTTMRTISYDRRRATDLQPNGREQLGMGAHTDYGVVTVLWADGAPGLQILGPDGDWHDVVPAPGALLVNLGDLTAEWTNDRRRSTLHRVLPPVTGTRRRSTAFFFDANWDAVIECVPTCTGPEDPPRYPPVVAGEHLMAKLMGPRTLRPSSAIDTAADRHGR